MNNKLEFVNTAFRNSEANFYEKDGLFLHYQAKLIDSEIDGKVDVMTDKDVLLSSSLKESDSINSRIVFSSVEGSVITNSVIGGSNVKASPIANSHITDTNMELSSIYDSLVRGSRLDKSHVRANSVVNSSVLINSYVKDRSVIDKAVIEYCHLDGCIVEADVKLSGIIPVPGTYFKHGFWQRNPAVVSSPELRYMVTEDVNDRVLIGCQSRPISFWLWLTPKQVGKMGEEFRVNFEEYRNAIFQMQRLKSETSSPEVLDTKPDDVLYTF